VAGISRGHILATANRNDIADKRIHGQTQAQMQILRSAQHDTSNLSQSVYGLGRRISR